MRTARINKKDVEAPEGAVAWKYNDPTEPARWVYDEDEARDIEGEDNTLIVWVENWEETEFTERTCENGYHDYGATICPECGKMFCESCASEVIWEPTRSVLRCPKCLHNYYAGEGEDAHD